LHAHRAVAAVIACIRRRYIGSPLGELRDGALAFHTALWMRRGG
jgi:hypothetical protein